MSSIFVTSCGQQQTKQQQQNKKAIGGVESSVTKMGDIEKVKIAVDKASIRSGCSDNTSVLQTSYKDNTLDVVSQVADWYAVKLPNNNIGFVPKDQCKPIVVEDKKPTTTPETTGTTPEGTTTPKTPSTKTNATTLTDSEKQMIKLVNDARAQNNVPPLEVDMQLTNVARIKCQDMIDNNYFSHNSPKYGSPFDMIKSFGVKFVQAGENIAGNQSVENAHNSLMNSPGHRQNILNPNYTHIGIGIKAGGPYSNMFSQMFISKPK
ncbi:serine protease [Clostridium tetanomorphum]|uniref:Serine protease n=2 Tax=Clostridium tetanomorphum TaxID=1553 RepID=A0A923ECE4_CLOTT|nr:serine protease [Clostridium tetanomorphum]